MASEQVIDPALGRIRDLGDRWRFEPFSLQAAKTFLTKCPPLPNPADNPFSVAKSLVDIRQTFRNSDTADHPKPIKSSSLPAASKPSAMPGCGGCHGPCGAGQHLGSRKGFVACSLEHYSGCPGSVIPVEGSMKPCPDGFVSGASGGHKDSETEISSGSESPSEQNLSCLEDDTGTDRDKSGPELQTRIERKFQSLKQQSSPSSTMTTPSPGLSVASSLAAAVPTSTFSSDSLSTTQLASTASYASMAPLMYPSMNFSTTQPAGAFNLHPQSLFSPLTQSQQVTGPTIILQQQLSALMTQQQQLAAAHAQEQQQQALVRQQEKEQLAEVQKQLQAVRHQLSVRPRTKSVSFSAEDLSSVSETARHLQAENSKSKKKSGNNIGLNIGDIRNSGMTGLVEGAMQDVYNIPSLGGNTPTPTMHGLVDGAGVATGLLTLEQQQAFFVSQQTAFFRQQQEVMANFQKQQQEFMATQQLQFGHGRQQQLAPELVKAQRRADRKAADEAASKAKSERKAARESRLKKAEAELSEIQKALKKAKRAVHKASGEAVDSDTDDEPDLDTTLTNRRQATISRTISLSDSESGEELVRQKPSSFTVDSIIVDAKSGKKFRVVCQKSKKVELVTDSSATSSSGEEAKREEAKRIKKRLKKERQRAAAASTTTAQVQGITPLPPVPASTQSLQSGQVKQGRGSAAESVKVLSVIDWAKLCPVKYASGLTHKNINLAMFMWGKLAELRAALAGATAPLEPGELNARLRHLQCVLELCNLNSQATDFTNYGWLLGKNYDEKIQSMIDSKTGDWVSHDSSFKTTLHPAFVMSAKDEVPRREIKKKGEGNGQTSDPVVKKKVCETFNTCRTKKKCTYEVENAPARCRRLHECSYCRENRNVREFHQSWDCGHGGRDAATADGP